MYKYLLILMLVVVPLYANAQGKGQGGATNSNQGMQGSGDMVQQRIQDVEEHMDDDEIVPTQQRLREDTPVNNGTRGTPTQQPMNNGQGSGGTIPGSGNGKMMNNVDVEQVVTNVGQRVRQIAQDPDRVGGIGQQVKQIAQEQVQTQEKIQQQLGKLEQRGNMLKFFFGQSKEDLDQLGQYVNQNKQRIEQLQELKEEVTDATEEMELNATIDDLLSQNDVLQQKIENEEFSGIAGWFKKVFRFQSNQ